MENLDSLYKKIIIKIDEANDLNTLNAVRIDYLGKKGKVTQLMKELANLTHEEKKSYGKNINSLKVKVLDSIEDKKLNLEKKIIFENIKKERLDVTLPERSYSSGYIHPISHTIEEIIGIFKPMGFSVAEGPDIEDDFHNFTALNFPPDHPAREMHDTFFLNESNNEERLLMRTHTSPVQIRVMKDNKPPIRVLAPGRTYRCDYDITHTPMFHQVEGLVIDKKVNMGHLKGCLTKFVESFFGINNLPVRFRPSYFPFTEPSAEVDIGCQRKDGEFKIGDGGEWLEILGCGMVHQNVLRACGLDPNEYQGFAFGLGVERIAMLKYGINDLRMFFDCDLRWIKHYGFSFLDNLDTFDGNN